VIAPRSIPDAMSNRHPATAPARNRRKVTSGLGMIGSVRAKESVPPNFSGCCCAGNSIGQGRVLGTGVEHLRYAAGLAHALVSFGPGREGSFGLRPMGDESLITPMQKTWHGFVVRPGDHELAHALLSVPGGHGPKSPASVSQQSPFWESGRLLYLPEGAEGIKRKRGTKRMDRTLRRVRLTKIMINWRLGFQPVILLCRRAKRTGGCYYLDQWI
jgi:hypothetical protein